MASCTSGRAVGAGTLLRQNGRAVQGSLVCHNAGISGILPKRCAWPLTPSARQAVQLRHSCITSAPFQHRTAVLDPAYLAKVLQDGFGVVNQILRVDDDGARLPRRLDAMKSYSRLDPYIRTFSESKCPIPALLDTSRPCRLGMYSLGVRMRKMWAISGASSLAVGMTVGWPSFVSQTVLANVLKASGAGRQTLHAVVGRSLRVEPDLMRRERPEHRPPTSLATTNVLPSGTVVILFQHILTHWLVNDFDIIAGQERSLEYSRPAARAAPDHECLDASHVRDLGRKV